jgi:hypothetical protein
VKNPTQRRKGAARQAATKQHEQEQTEKTERGKLCAKCRVFVNSTAKAQRVVSFFATLRLCDFALRSPEKAGSRNLESRRA